ncbi:hypothetical protein GW17_00012812 [Ensete ventricosum]|nr:hypothetical protein GW17_00012812 [Ensete ventricosum]
MGTGTCGVAPSRRRPPSLKVGWPLEDVARHHSSFPCEVATGGASDRGATRCTWAYGMIPSWNDQRAFMVFEYGKRN